MRGKMSARDGKGEDLLQCSDAGTIVLERNCEPCFLLLLKCDLHICAYHEHIGKMSASAAANYTEIPDVCEVLLSQCLIHNTSAVLEIKGQQTRTKTDKDLAILHPDNLGLLYK